MTLHITHQDGTIEIAEKKEIFHRINHANIDYTLPKLIYDLERMFDENKLNKIFVHENFKIESEKNNFTSSINYYVTFSYSKFRDEKKKKSVICDETKLK